MKIIRHTARDMRQALRAVREQLGEDAVILSSRRTSEGVEVTAAVDFDAATLESGGFAETAAVVAPARETTKRAPSAPPIMSASTEWISPAAREAVVEHAHAVAAVQIRGVLPQVSAPAEPIILEEPPGVTDGNSTFAAAAPTLSPATESYLRAAGIPIAARTEVPVFREDGAIERAHAAALSPFDVRPELAEGETQPASAGPAGQPATVQTGSGQEAMGHELKALRRILETQLAHLAWNDRIRRAPIHTEILRELTEIGVAPELAERLVKQLPDDTDLTFARRFTIAGLSQYLQVTGERWLDGGGRVAFAGATGAGKTTTLAKVAVRWVLRHGPHSLALVAADGVRIGAQEQLRSLGQLLGVPVYSPESFEALPGLLSRLSERLVLIDTPGSGARDAQLTSRLQVLANVDPKLETALVLSASMQAGALDEAVRRFAPAVPACCILTKLDEAASLGGLLSILIRAKLPVSYVSEGQRVPEDLRPARALELVSVAVQLAKASGAAADEDLLRRRFGKTAHGT